MTRVSGFTFSITFVVIIFSRLTAFSVSELKLLQENESAKLLLNETDSVAIVKGINVPSGLKVNQLINPLAIDIRQPTFSWIVNSNKRGDYQVAYQIIVSSTKTKAENNECDIWDSGKIISEEQSDITYKGIPLESTKDYYWKVCTWNKDNKQSKWSYISRFATGMFQISDWKGKFIGKRNYQLYRQEFVSDSTKNIESALLYIGSWGVPVVYINGCKVGDVVLNTADCVLRKTTWYRGFDVTNMIGKNRNAIGVMMGYGLLGREDGDPSDIRFILNLVIKYRDSSSKVISSDGTWKATKKGPLIEDELNNVMDGEKYNAQKEQKGWNEPLFDDSKWDVGNNVLNLCEPENTLKSQSTPPMKVIETIKPQNIKEVFPGTYVVDAGRNLTGWAQLKVNGKKGDKVEMRFAEDLSTLWNDYSFSVAANIVSGTAGILFRAVNENNYYYWKLTTSGKIAAYKNVNGVMKAIKEIPINLSFNTRYEIKIKVIGNKIKTYCNNILIDTLYDSTFLSGKVGFRESKSDTARFTDIKIINEVSNKILLVSSGKNPGLWLNNENLNTSGNQLEITNNEYVVSCFGNIIGDIDQSSLSVPSFVPDAMGAGAMQYDYYIHGGDGVETWEPFQTIHGFRYIEVKGYDGLDTGNINIRIVHEAVDEEKENLGFFNSSNQLINNLYKASISSIKSSFQWGIPASCVSRDERGGWTGDAESTSQAANYYTDVEPSYKQWFEDMRETQHSDGYIDNLAPRQGERAGAIEEDIPWSSAVINVTWDTYFASGNKSIITEQYGAMKRFINWCVNTSNFSTSTENYEDYTTNKDCWGDYGSLLESNSCCPIPMPEKSLLATAFFYNSTVRLSILANEIGEKSESTELSKLASKIRNAYNKKFLKEDAQGTHYLGNTQAANAISLAFGLCPKNKKPEVAMTIVKELENTDYSLTIGVLGLYTIFDALCDNGYTEAAYKIVSKTTYPSWGYWIKKGATSMWEFWDGRGSHNHMFMGGKMNAFLIKNLAGISPLKPGYASVLIKPGIVGDLTNIKSSVYSPKGKIETDWIKNSNYSFTLKTFIPLNSTAEVYIPLLENKASDAVISEGNSEIYKNGIKKDNEIIKFIKKEDGYLVFKVASGSYEFNINKK